MADVKHTPTAIEIARDEGFSSGTIAALGVVTAMDCGVTWGEIVRAAGTHQILVHALTNEGDWEWAGFKRYAKNELSAKDIAKARRAARKPIAKATGAARATEGSV